jgi:hypothetical protein
MPTCLQAGLQPLPKDITISGWRPLLTRCPCACRYAVTVATLVTGHTSVSRGLAYIVAQIAGCALAAAMHVSD